MDAPLAPRVPPAVVQPEKLNASAVTTQEFVTVTELTRLLEQERSKKQPDDLTYEHYPPYPIELQHMPYPKGHPTLTLYNGRGNAREHISRFLEALGEHEENANLRLENLFQTLARGMVFSLKSRGKLMRFSSEMHDQIKEKDDHYINCEKRSCFLS